MRYIDIKTNEEIWIHKIRSNNPNISIPDNADLSALGYILVEPTEMPVKDGFYAVDAGVIDFKQVWELKPIMAPLEEIPNSITSRQIRLKLLELEKLDDILEIIEQQDEPMKTKLKIEWEYATEFNRDNIFINTLAPNLGLEKEDVDKIFIEASKI